MKKNKRHHQLHDSVIEDIRVDSLFSKIEIILENRVGGNLTKWMVTCLDVVRFSGSTRFPERNFIDVYDLIEVFDEECTEWQKGLMHTAGSRPNESNVHKLLFASLVFAGTSGEGGIEIVCRKYSVQNIS